jgi:hypothetical protein
VPSYFKILSVCVLAAFLFGVPHQAFAARCLAPKPILKYAPTISKTKYNISESAFDLHRYHGGQGAGLVTGLALSPLYYEFESQFRVTQIKEGYCLAIDELKLYYRARPVVWISSEFPRGSCEFKAVLFHENKHVRTLKKVHSKSSKAFRKHVENSLERVRPEGPLSKAQIKTAQKKMQKELEQLLDEYIIDINYELRREQTKVDSPSEYKRVNDECDEWLGRLRLQ